MSALFSSTSPRGLPHGTASEVTPVRSVDRLPVGAGRPGPVTLELQRRYVATVKGEGPDPRGWLTYVRSEAAPATR